ncbi:hypothetical protein HaLaN_26925 [Haematococcus lacustris]|uniref:Uncharacterized protein n=1 Tax=Haematococcus lacustris TaxID=44745 RepID=A0A6A0A7E0_HAELA|nr:hypothetical protein HaLaN_26925 [Haematococcus lacustris]
MKVKERKGADDPKQPKPKVPKPKGLGWVGPVVSTGTARSCLADKRAFQCDPATQMGMALDPGAIQAVSAALGVWDKDGCLQSLYIADCKLTRSQVQHDSGLIQARRNSQRWNDNVKLKLQHLAAATPAGTSQL